MVRLALFITLEAIPGKELDLEEFLGVSRILSEREPGTISWYAFKLGPATYGIFDTFKNETDRQAHLAGDIARSLEKYASELLAAPPHIQKLEVLATK